MFVPGGILGPSTILGPSINGLLRGLGNSVLDLDVRVRDLDLSSESVAPLDVSPLLGIVGGLVVPGEGCGILDRCGGGALGMAAL